MKCLEIFGVGFKMSLWLLERASVNYLDGIFTQKSESTGKDEEGEPGSGGEDFPSHSAVVVGHCLL
jgi:hypothetical protein